jgi:Glycosyl transferase family 2
MRLVMTLLVRDEEELLEANLEYHFAQGVDFAIVTDHGSTDATPEILDEYASRGLVRVLRTEGDQHHQSRRVTRMARLAAVEYGADWVINNDADEFWWPAVGSLHDVFAAIPEHVGQIAARRNNFLPRPVDRDEPFHQQLVVREKDSQNIRGEELEPKIAHRADPGVIVAPGNHSVTNAWLPPSPVRELVEVLHFPMRTPEQFERKVLSVGRGYESLPFRSMHVGRDQLQLLELQRRGELQQYFARHLVSDEALAAGLRGGELVIDRRLAQFMAQLEMDGLDGYQLSARPDSDAARRLIAAALRAPNEP